MVGGRCRRVGKLGAEGDDVRGLGRGADEELVAHGISSRASAGSHVEIGRSLAQGHEMVHLAVFEVVINHVVLRTEAHDGAVGFGETDVVEAVDARQLRPGVGHEAFVDVIEGEEEGLLAIARIDSLHFLRIGDDAAVAPPLYAVEVLDGAVVIVASAGDKVVEREAFQFLCHGNDC